MSAELNARIQELEKENRQLRDALAVIECALALVRKAP